MNAPQISEPVRIPADVERDDRVLGNLTARQLAILAVVGAVLYGAWVATRNFVPAVVYAVIAVPIALAAVGVALGSRDGIPLDRLLLAAVRQRVSPRLLVAAPVGVQPAPDWLVANAGSSDPASRTAPGQLRLPAGDVTETGAVDLGPDGIAVVAVASTVNFALRTPTEQERLVAVFARFLHSLTAPVQILIRAERLDLSAQIHDLVEHAGGLPHPALEAAAREHAEFLTQLAGQADLLRRQVLLVFREPLPGPASRRGTRQRQTGISAGRDAAAWQVAETRLSRRLTEAVELLSTAGITITLLDAGQTTAVLAAACNPDHLVPPTVGLAGADEVITTPAAGDEPTMEAP